jgi:Uma2 family endonuclease
LHRISPELYDRLVDSGLLDGEPVELVDGLLVHVTPQGAEHAALVRRLMLAFVPRADLLRVQMPLAVPGGRPEPDLALAHDAGPRQHPPTSELVVEVAVTSLSDDLAKLAGYAAADVKVAWIVDVPARTVRVFEQPYGRRYERERILDGDDTLSAPVDGVSPLTVRELFAVLEA